MNNRFSAWLKLMVTTVLLPLIILGSGGLYLVSLNRDIRFRAFETEAGEKLETMRLVAETEKYLCNSLAELFDRGRDALSLRTDLEKFLQAHGIKLKFLIWEPSGKISYANFAFQQFGGDWEAAFLQMKMVAARSYGGAEKNIPPEVLANLRTVFGPHFFPRFFHTCFSGRIIRLIRSDSTMHRPPTWLNVGDRFGLLVIVDNEVLRDCPGLWHMVNTNSGDLVSGYVASGSVVCRDSELSATLQGQTGILQRSFRNHLDVSGYFLFTNYINERLTGFCAVKKGLVENFAISRMPGLILFSLLLWLAAFAVFSYRVIVQKSQLTLGIRRQLLLLFIVANTLPGFILLIIGSDYLQQLRGSLVNSVYNQSMAYLQSIDELFNNEYTVQKVRFNKHFVEFQSELKQNRVNQQTMQGFLDKQSPKPYRMFLVASSTGMVAGSLGILKNGKVHESFKRGFRNDSIRINTMDAVYKLGTFILAYLNKTPVSSKTGTEVEFIAASLMQKTPSELIRQFFERGTFFKWGIGMKKHPTFIEIFQLFDRSVYDYLLLYLWDSNELELEFISRIFSNLNRNDLGLNIMAVNEDFTAAFPAESMKNRRLKEFAFKLRDRTITRPEFCNLDGEEYLLAGHKCIFMETIRLFALYPVERIDQQVAAKKHMLLLLVLVSLLVSVSLGMFVASGILRPLAELQTGVTALRERNFAYRVANLGGDEFGHLASIFNDMLVDLEEMHVASTVQEKLMTQMTEPGSACGMTFFGQTVSLVSMGGDYFELVETDKDSPALMMGDVAGRGVGTCLLLAFVKSAIMQLHENSSLPGKLMTGLHELIRRSSGDGQNRTISLQYLLPVAEGRIELVNAGLPGQIIIDHAAGKVRQLPASLLPLGSDEFADLPVTTVELGRGQSLVSFSHGILRNGSISDEQIFELVQRTRKVNPQEFCGAFLEEYFKLTSRSECTDDVSLFIIHYPES